jgi:uncharacterized protein YjeT (DUF2065 family)
MTVEVLLTGLGIAFLLEGLMPLIAPARWRQVFSQMLDLKDGQLRFIGLAAVLAGLTLILI